MLSRPVTLMVCALGLSLGLGAMLVPNADAANKKKKPVAPQITIGNAVSCRGANKFECGPLYNGPDYLGSDPDPFIRAMIQRDLAAKYGPGD